MSKSAHTETLSWLERSMAECRKIALRYFGSRLTINRKSDRSPVTIADKTIEEYLRRAIGRAFPKDGIVGEEFGTTRGSSGAYWTLDPIDGTRPFTRGLPSWGILAARVERGVPVVGACDLPALGTFLGAARGAAAFERTKNVQSAFPRPRRFTSLKEAVIFHGGASFFFQAGYGKQFERIVSNCYLERAYGDCYAYLWALRGHADIMMDYGVHEWDLAPFAVMAGSTGRVLVNFKGQSDFKGPDTLFGSSSAVKLLLKNFSSS
ncbi:MAG: hypothetical protein HY586_01825 [Candidatus Omnitrophica bacterium]|nr:hypothetical protein [Candidatus Omnitrophota bacterium]